MAIKEIPTNSRVYYKSMKDAIKPKYEKAVNDYETLLVELKADYADLKLKIELYKSTFKFNLMSYEEFVNNEYSTGEFYNASKDLFINKKKNNIATTSAYNVYKFARKQKDIYNLKHDIDVWGKMLDLNFQEYSNVLQAYYNEVHKRLIINGYGYALENPLGCICINRCKMVQGERRLLNFQATKRNKERLLNEGKRLWNKEEADYANLVGQDYDGVDYRVFLEKDVVYEFPLINCRLNNGERYRFYTAFARRHIKGKTEDQLIEECNYDLEKICELPVDIRLKLNLCLKTDNILYLNFIRNEAQQSAHTPKTCRKSRQ